MTLCWCQVIQRRLQIQINLEKCQAVLFQKRRLPTPNNLVIEENEIEWSKEAKCLGILVDSKLTWKRNTEELRRKTKTATGKLYPLLCRNSKTDHSVKIRIIRAIARSQLTYCSSVWGHAANSHISRLSGIENSLIRMALNVPWFVRNEHLFRDIKWTKFQEHIKEKATKFYALGETHTNSLIRTAANPDPEAERRTNRHTRYRRPKDILQQ